MIPYGVSSGYLRLGANVPGKHIGVEPKPKELILAPIEIRASKEAPSDMDVGPARMSRENATGMGYTGDACDHCGSMRMKHTGHCNTCEECGTTTGCS
jgi:hypothetical protein